GGRKPTLVGGSNCSGRVEIKYDGSWGTVCNDSWDLKVAQVVCRQLGCGEPASADLEFDGGIGIIWLNKMVSSSLCHFSVFYTGYTGYRLVNGADSCSGRVELQFGGKWGTVCDQYWTLKDGNVLCHQLKCGYAIEAPGQARFGEGSGEIWADIFGCEGSETHLSKCPTSVWERGDCTHANDVICSLKDGGVRLLGGQQICEGRVEVFYNRTGSRVIDNSWGDKESSVVCRQLGMQPSTSYLYGKGKGNVYPKWLDNVRCRPRDSCLRQCPSSPWGKNKCSNDEVAVITCSVEIKYDGSWGTVCNDAWDLKVAQVVCRQLGCGEPASADLEFGGGIGIIWLNKVNCIGLESFFQDLKLVNGRGPCEGRVEVLRNRQWGTVCDNSWDWDMKDAAVVCRQLGCGEALSAPVYAHFGRGTGPVLMSRVNCKGQESALKDCESRTYSCDHYRDVSAVCSGYTGYRLVNGTDSCSGRVELQFDGKWGTVCDQYWTLKDANVLCHQLNCGYATEAPGQASFGEGIGEIWADIFGCEGSETHLSKCPISVWGRGDCSHNIHSAICHEIFHLCSQHKKSLQDIFPFDSISSKKTLNWRFRLLGGQGICEGRVEVFYNRTWSRVIDNSWGDRESSVVCRQLGCGSGIEASTSYLYGNGKGNVCVTGIQCSERNSHLKSCTRPQTAHCGISHDVAVICSDINQIKMRLTEGCSGKLQVFYSGTWGSVCQNQMDPHTATMICRELGCYNLTSLNVGNSEIDGDPKWLDNVRCRPHDSYLRQCPSSPWGKNKCNNDEVAVITCSELRLVGGSNCSGRVEIKYDGSWGTVCDDSWDLKDAQVVCRQLGCGEPASADLEFGGGIGIIWLNKVNCIGLESFLWDCPHALVGLNDCHHKEDAGFSHTPWGQNAGLRVLKRAQQSRISFDSDGDSNQQPSGYQHRSLASEPSHHLLMNKEHTCFEPCKQKKACLSNVFYILKQNGKKKKGRDCG
uniref:SRCR domain-containing protein n=1 Tax=Erpetoichthys calabaricus TaxID=27687 RepID=A0A8C4TFD4_ERPCA